MSIHMAHLGCVTLFKLENLRGYVADHVDDGEHGILPIPKALDFTVFWIQKMDRLFHDIELGVGPVLVASLNKLEGNSL